MDDVITKRPAASYEEQIDRHLSEEAKKRRRDPQAGLPDDSSDPVRETPLAGTKLRG